MNIKFLTVDDISKLINCSKTNVYRIIKELNSELEYQGSITSKDRVNE